jgi:hypothetical protein
MAPGSQRLEDWLVRWGRRVWLVTQQKTAREQTAMGLRRGLFSEAAGGSVVGRMTPDGLGQPLVRNEH